MNMVGGENSLFKYSGSYFDIPDMSEIILPFTETFSVSTSTGTSIRLRSEITINTASTSNTNLKTMNLTPSVATTTFANNIKYSPGTTESAFSSNFIQSLNNLVGLKFIVKSTVSPLSYISLGIGYLHDSNLGWGIIRTFNVSTTGNTMYIGTDNYNEYVIDSVRTADINVTPFSTTMYSNEVSSNDVNTFVTTNSNLYVLYKSIKTI